MMLSRRLKTPPPPLTTTTTSSTIITKLEINALNNCLVSFLKGKLKKKRFKYLFLFPILCQFLSFHRLVLCFSTSLSFLAVFPILSSIMLTAKISPSPPPPKFVFLPSPLLSFFLSIYFLLVLSQLCRLKDEMKYFYSF